MQRSPLLFGALVGFFSAIALVTATLLDPTLFGLEWIFYDPATRVVARRERPDPAIVIVAINQKTVETLADTWGRPPYSRELMARAIDELRVGQARAVVFDLLFSEPNLNDDAGDRLFAEGLGTLPVVLGANTRENALPSEEEGAFADKLWTIRAAAAPPLTLDPPLPLFRRAAAIGTLRLSKETAVARDYLTVDPVSPFSGVPSLGLAAIQLIENLPREGGWEGGRFRTGPLSIPLDRPSSFLLRWVAPPSGRRNPYPIFDFSDLILASIAREEGVTPEKIDSQLQEHFRGRIVLIGNTAAGLFDLRATPLAPNAPGIEIHANAIDNLKNGRFNRRASRLLDALAMVFITTFAGALLSHVRSQLKAAGLLAILILGWLAAGALLLSQGVVVSVVAPVLASILAYTVITAEKYVSEQKHGVQLRLMFGRYVSPQILDHILAHPEKVELGGERREMTILFSDIRGFTTISEAAEPEEVVEMLNEYLTRMVEILLRHGGTLDKFIGDAVMGFWNAPMSDPDHAQHAVDCAIEMIDETARLRAQWETEGKASLRIGIGVNTGEAVVGNIGSRQVFGYTVIGDAVNLASRLEGKNKDYGTEIIISEATKDRIRQAIPTVYLDEVRVKGKEKAVKIYEIKGNP